MNFDPDNNIVKLCAQGMSMEAQGNPKAAAKLFLQAWADSTNVLEKSISAHYVARHQYTIENKLMWDQTALHFALQIQDEKSKSNLPSLYLNIGKCYEDLYDPAAARKHYESALSYSPFLPGDGYGKMIISGIENALQRVSSMPE